MTSAGWVSLSFDDGLDEHLDRAVPILGRHGLQGTFYVHLAAPGFVRRLEEWKRAAQDGHELGNHTVFHPADARKDWVRAGNAIDDYSLDRMRLELEFANDWLGVLDGRRERTFAYPCSNSCIGHDGWVRRALGRSGLDRTRLAGWVDRFHLDWGSTRQSYEPVVAELFIAGRGGGLAKGAVVPPTGDWRRTRLLSVAVEGWSFEDLRNHVTAGVARGTWVILQFHGVGGGHWMDCPLDAFCDFTTWLHNEHAERVVTVLEGARRLWPTEPADLQPASTASPERFGNDLCAGRDDVMTKGVSE